jgi:hypothetical protein
MKAYSDSIDWVYANPDKAIGFYVKFNKVPPDIAKQTLQSFPKTAVTPWPVRGLKRNIEEAVQAKQLERSMSEAEAQKLMYDFVYEKK